MNTMVLIQMVVPEVYRNSLLPSLGVKHLRMSYLHDSFAQHTLLLHTQQRCLSLDSYFMLSHSWAQMQPRKSQGSKRNTKRLLMKVVNVCFKNKSRYHESPSLSLKFCSLRNSIQLTPSHECFITYRPSEWFNSKKQNTFILN